MGDRCPEEAAHEVPKMAPTSADSKQVIRSFVEHEHEELRPGVDRIHRAACELASLPADQVSVRVATVLHWVERTLRPHMAWEESWLYPQIDDRARTPWATRLIRYDHQQILQLAERLGSDRVHLEHGPTHEAAMTARCDLFALEALVRAHVEREERFLLPLLDQDASTWATRTWG
jgi:iron-sulfur cluster repair protein YtfE (RIC family)